MKISVITCLLLLLISSDLIAQQYNATELSPVKPSQVLIENYTRINLAKEVTDDAMANQFDSNNPYTYLQLLNDEKGNMYHIVFQTNFYGKILLLAYSNNMAGLFNKVDKPMFLFQHCLKEMNVQLSPVQVTRIAIKCVVDRLNYCAGD